MRNCCCTRDICILESRVLLHRSFDLAIKTGARASSVRNRRSVSVLRGQAGKAAALWSLREVPRQCPACPVAAEWPS